VLLHGKCHCGNIAVQLRWPAERAHIPARECGCSFCIKHGGVWTSHPAAALTVTIRDSSHVSQYSFGTETARFHVCSRCGAVPFVSSEIDSRLYAVVNVNVLENVDKSMLHRAAANFEGEDVERRLARRSRNWIADVRVADAAK